MSLKLANSNDVCSCFSQQWESFAHNPDKFNLIGPLKSHAVWLCHRGNQLVMFQPIRAQEELIYHRLVGNHILPSVALESPISLNPQWVKPPFHWLALKPLVVCQIITYLWLTDVVNEHEHYWAVCVDGARSVGGDKLWTTLLCLERSTSTPQQPLTYFTDTRLLGNGFKLRYHQGK